MGLPLSPPLRFHFLPGRVEKSLSGDLETNVKRESKVYSYEDQKWDAQVRLELQRRRQTADARGRERGDERDVRSLLKDAKLTPKQMVG